MGLPHFIATVPVYEVVRGQMHIIIGDVVLVMAINDFLVGCAKGKAAIVKWERERQASAEIVPFRRELADRH